MLDKVYRFLLNRKNIAPPLDAGFCCVPGCSEPASEQWFPSFCALREAGVPIDWVSVCAEHDVQLNERQVRFLFGDQHDDALREYRVSRVEHAPAKEAD